MSEIDLGGRIFNWKTLILFQLWIDLGEGSELELRGHDGNRIEIPDMGGIWLDPFLVTIWNHYPMSHRSSIE